MDTIVEAICAASSADELKSLCAMLRVHEEVLFRHAMQLDELSGALQAPAHTLGLIFVLNVRASVLAPNNSSPLGTAFAQRCRDVLLNADRAQVAHAPAEFARLCAKYLTFALSLPQGALSAVRPLLAAAETLQPSPEHVTPIHPLALQAAILAKCYRAVEPLLARTLVHVDVKATHVTAHDVLLLNYYSGIALIGLKRHRAAMESFLLVITAPALVLNSIMVEAYKKWVMCALIHLRTLPQLPKYTATIVQRNTRNCAPAYNELASAFQARDRSKLDKTVASQRAAFTKDGNMGLVKQCVAAFTKCAASATIARPRRPPSASWPRGWAGVCRTLPPPPLPSRSRRFAPFPARCLLRAHSPRPSRNPLARAAQGCDRAAEPHVRDAAPLGDRLVCRPQERGRGGGHHRRHG
jgi:COP9 signalosome complex subunit 3